MQDLPVSTVALLVTLAGTVLSLGGAAWLFFGIRPDNPAYEDDGMLYPGQHRSEVLPRFIRAQQRPSVLVLIGGGVQVLGGALTLLA
jgi:hypothetical protein